MRLLVVIVSVFCITHTALAADEPALTAQEILQKAKQVYRELQTYESRGIAEVTTQAGGHQVGLKTEFSIRLQKPSRFLIKWTQHIEGAPIGPMDGAAWSDGTQAFVYLGSVRAYGKVRDDMAAIGAATGVSAGAAWTVPTLFLESAQQFPLKQIEMMAPTLGPGEAMGDDECYVIHGATGVWQDTTIWISKKSFLIRKYMHTLEHAQDRKDMAELTDEQLDEVAEGMGLEPNEDSRARVRELTSRAQAIGKANQNPGLMIEIHEQVTTPELTAADFNFEVPAGVALKESLFGELLKTQPVAKPGN